MATNKFSVEILRHPTEEDWKWVKTCTLNTVGKTSVTNASEEWKKKLINAEHSPLRELWFGIKIIAPYYSVMHFVRHHIGVNHYVQTQRNDRQKTYDRAAAPQGASVSYIMSVNAQELIFMSHKRLCGQADPLTRAIMEEIVRQVVELNPEFEHVLVPLCGYRNGVCTEFYCCGKNRKYLPREN